MDLKTQSYIKELENIKQKIKETVDDETRSYLIKLFCIRTSGLLEVFFKTRISEYFKTKVPNEISRFLTSKFKDITNLKTSKLVEVLSSFSTDWSEKFSSYIDEHEQMKSSLDSIISQRHAIAHGQPSCINEKDMYQYYDDVKAIVVFIDGVIR